MTLQHSYRWMPYAKYFFKHQNSRLWAKLPYILQTVVWFQVILLRLTSNFVILNNKLCNITIVKSHFPLVVVVSPPEGPT